MATSDNRRHRRKKTIFNFDVRDRATGELLGHALDITRGGLMLLSNGPIEKGVLYEMRMVFPFEFGGSAHMDFDAMSVWCARDVNEQYYDTGFEFAEIAEADLARIDDLLDEYTFRG